MLGRAKVVGSMSISKKLRVTSKINLSIIKYNRLSNSKPKIFHQVIHPDGKIEIFFGRKAIMEKFGVHRRTFDLMSSHNKPASRGPLKGFKIIKIV
jgi:hypothetical protein